jgi:hypothetical protein
MVRSTPTANDHVRTRVIGALVAGSILGALGQHWLASGPPAASASAKSETSDCPAGRAAAPAARPQHRPVTRPYLTRPEELFVARDEEAQQEYRVRQSNELIDLLMMRIGAMSRPGFGDDPEVVASSMAMYQKGMIDAVVRTAPDLVEELAARLERSICEQHARPAQQVSLMRVIQDMPELANPGTFDCIFENGREDIVLWTALDSWKAAGRPDTPRLQSLRSHARDPRTLSRLRPPREEDEAERETAEYPAHIVEPESTPSTGETP